MSDALRVEVVRSGVVESTHAVSVVALRPDGSVALAHGAIDIPIFPRSSNKPLQAVALLEAGWVPPDAEALALATASHSGLPAHLAVVRRTLSAAGLPEEALACPAQLPLDVEAAHALLREGAEASPLTMNCSGKHAAMLATCVANGWPTEGYLSPEHPVQQAIRSWVEKLAGEPVPHIAVDGCGAPQHALTLTGVARAYSRLVTDDGSCRRVADAMRAHPELVGGPGRENTRLMAGIPGLVAKDGAEAVFAVALADGSAAAVKVLDGSNRAAVPALVVALRALGVSAPVLDELATTPVLGGGKPVGEVRPAPVLEPVAEAEPAAGPETDAEPDSDPDPIAEPAPAPVSRRQRLLRRLGVLLVLVEVAAILAMSAAAVTSTRIFATGDEGYHLSYAVHIAEGRGLPTAGETYVHKQVLSIQEDRYPGSPNLPATWKGNPFRGTSYEAFQPPLYYALAAPFTTLSDHWPTKVENLRWLAVGLIAVAIGLLYLLCRLVRPKAPLPVFAVAVLAFATPAFREQEIPVSNDVLLLPLALGFACCAWLALTRRSLLALLGASLLTGALLLTKLTSVWALAVLGVAGLVVLLTRTSWRARIGTVLIGVVPLAMLAPWFAMNLGRYDALTGNARVLALQAKTSPPTFPSFAEEAEHVLVVLAHLILGRRTRFPELVNDAATVLALTVVLLAFVVVLRRWHRLPSVLLLAVPLPLMIAVLGVMSVRQGTELLYERYLHPVTPLAMLAVGLVLFGALPRTRELAARLRPGSRRQPVPAERSHPAEVLALVSTAASGEAERQSPTERWTPWPPRTPSSSAS